MARINLTQAINLIVVENVDGKPSQKTLNLVRGINEVDPSVLVHPYIQSHMKAGSCSIVPDPMDPEDIAAAAEEIARQARARAEAAKALKDAKQKEIDDAMASASKSQVDVAAKAALALRESKLKDAVIEPKMAPVEEDDDGDDPLPEAKPAMSHADAQKHDEEAELQRMIEAEEAAKVAAATAEKPAA